MSFNKTLILLFTILLSGCGVKAAPQKYPDTIVESYVGTYTKEAEPEINEEAKETPAKAPQN